MNFQCENWECSLYKVAFKIQRVRVRVKQGEVQYLNEGKQISCTECNRPCLEVKDEEFKGFATSFGCFDSKTPEEKRDILKKRESFYQKRDKEFKEYKKFKDDENG